MSGPNDILHITFRYNDKPANVDVTPLIPGVSPDATTTANRKLDWVHDEIARLRQNIPTLDVQTHLQGTKGDPLNTHYDLEARNSETGYRYGHVDLSDTDNGLALLPQSDADFVSLLALRHAMSGDFAGVSGGELEVLIELERFTPASADPAAGPAPNNANTLQSHAVGQVVAPTYASTRESIMRFDVTPESLNKFASTLQSASVYVQKVSDERFEVLGDNPLLRQYASAQISDEARGMLLDSLRQIDPAELLESPRIVTAIRGMLYPGREE